MFCLRLASLLLIAVAAPACLVPLALEPEAAPDGGTILMVTGADPLFGTLPVLGKFDTISNFTIDVVTDSSAVASRLYLQFNGSCCDLNLEKQPVTARFLQQADTSPIDVGGATTGRYTISFRQAVQPCAEASSGAIVFIVPVVASDGFKDGPTKVGPEGLGLTDNRHYWTVNCP